MVDVKIIGRRKLNAQLKKMSNDLRNDLGIGMEHIIEQMKYDVESTIDTGARSGRIYKRGSRMHQASAPGEFPKTDTGELTASFYKEIQKKFNQVIGILGNDAPYAKAVEFKPASDGGRPFMRPTWKKWRDPASNFFKQIIKSSIKRNSK